MVGVNGRPLVRVKISPICQPEVVHFANPFQELEVGTFQIALTTATFRISKSESPRRSFGSNKGRLETEFPNVSPAIPDELVSMLFENVYEPWSWKP